MDKKIILISILPIANTSNFLSQVKDWSEIKKKNYTGKEDLLELCKLNYSEEIKDKINETDPFILINYPKNKKQLESFIKDTSIEKLSIKLVLIIIEKFELASELMKIYLVCPFCEKSYLRSEVIEEGKFICPKDKEFKIPLKKIELFNEELNRDFLENKEVINFFNNSSSTILPINIRDIKEIYSPEELSRKILGITKRN